MDFGFIPLLLWALICLFGIYCFFISIYQTLFYRKKQSSNKKEIENSFLKHKIFDGFDPASAVIVRDRYEYLGKSNTSVTLHRICRFKDEYYLFICAEGEAGYLTQLSTKRVINALRSTPDILHREFPDAK